MDANALGGRASSTKTSVGGAYVEALLFLLPLRAPYVGVVITNNGWLDMSQHVNELSQIISLITVVWDQSFFSDSQTWKSSFNQRQTLNK